MKFISYAIFIFAFSGSAQAQAPAKPAPVQPAAPVAAPAKATAPAAKTAPPAAKAAAKPAAPATAAAPAAQPAAPGGGEPAVKPPPPVPDVVQPLAVTLPPMEAAERAVKAKSPSDMPPMENMQKDIASLAKADDRVKRIDYYIAAFLKIRKDIRKEEAEIVTMRAKECVTPVPACQDITELATIMCATPEILDFEAKFWKAYFPNDKRKKRAYYTQQFQAINAACNKVNAEARMKLLLNILLTDLKGANRDLQDEVLLQISHYKLPSLAQFEFLSPEVETIIGEFDAIKPTPMRGMVGFAEATLMWIPNVPVTAKTPEEVKKLGSWMEFVANTLSTVGRAGRFAKLADAHPEIFNLIKNPEAQSFLGAYCKYWSINGGAAKCDRLMALLEKKNAGDPDAELKMRYRQARKKLSVGDFKGAHELQKEVLAEAKRQKNTVLVPWIQFLDAVINLNTGKDAAVRQTIQVVRSFWNNEAARNWETYNLETVEMALLIQQKKYKEAKELGDVTLKKLDAKVDGEASLKMQLRLGILTALIGLGQEPQAKELGQTIIQKLRGMPDLMYMKYFVEALLNRKDKNAMNRALATSEKLLGKNNPDQVQMVQTINAMP